jgi:predicted nucleic acid-binding protein
MRVVLDTNIIVSALFAPAGKPAAHAAKATCGQTRQTAQGRTHGQSGQETH